MASDPLGKLASDARERPLLYATVAVAGLAGIAAAVALTSRADSRSSSRKGSLADSLKDLLGDSPGDSLENAIEGSRTALSKRGVDAAALLRTARDALGDAGGRASDTAGDAAGSAQAKVRDTARDTALDATRRAREALRDALDDAPEPERGTVRKARDAAASAGIGESTMAVMLGTLLSKAFTGWMRLQAEERARAQGMALAGGVGSGRDEGGHGGGDEGGKGDRLATGGRLTAALDAHLADLTVIELRALAAEREIAGRSSMNKGELVEALDPER